MNVPFNILVHTHNGLNDGISELIDTYMYISRRLKKEQFNIDFLMRNYKDLDRHFIFNEKINTIQSRDHKKSYDLEILGVYNRNINIYNIKEINNIIKFKNSNLFLNKYNDYIGIHFRHTENEYNNKDYGVIKEYKEKFLNIYNEYDNYLIVSDNSVWPDIFKNYKNIDFLVPTHNINIQAEKGINRYNNTELSINTILALSSCKYIYKTKGNFTNLTLLVKDNITLLQM